MANIKKIIKKKKNTNPKNMMGTKNLKIRYYAILKN